MKPLSVKQCEKNIDITTLLIYCQLLIGTPPPVPVWFGQSGLSASCLRTPPTVSFARGCYGEYIASLLLLKWQRKPSTLLKREHLVTAHCDFHCLFGKFVGNFKWWLTLKMDLTGFSVIGLWMWTLRFLSMYMNNCATQSEDWRIGFKRTLIQNLQQMKSLRKSAHPMEFVESSSLNVNEIV